MAIQQAQQIKINGDTQFLGGSIYNFSYRPSLGDTYSTATVSVVNESGDYGAALSLISVRDPIYTIDINGLEVKMLLAEVEEEEGESGKYLTCEFVSEEILYLDRYQVQLRDRIAGVDRDDYEDEEGNTQEIVEDGEKVNRQTTVSTGYVLVVGHRRAREQDSFRFQLATDGLSRLGEAQQPINIAGGYGENNELLSGEGWGRIFIDVVDLAPWVWQDGVDPLRLRPEPPYYNEYWYDDLDLPDITYTFQDLIDEIEYFIGVDVDVSDISFNAKYRADYTGSLREVLSSWCNDFGYIFFWEDDKITIKDTSEGSRAQEIIANATAFETAYADDGIISKRKKHSLFDTVSRATNTLFLRDGSLEEADVDQDIERTSNFLSLRLEDLPSFDTYDKAQSLYEGDDLFRVKAAHYGTSMIYAVNSLTNIGNPGETKEWDIPVDVFNDPADPESGTTTKIYQFAKYRLLDENDNTDAGIINFVEQQLTNYIGSGDWNWVLYEKEPVEPPEIDNPGDQKVDYDSPKTFFRIYEAAARFWGKFFYEPCTWSDWERREYADSSSVYWIRATEFVKNTPIGPFVEPLRHYMAHNIANRDGDTLYDQISIDGIIKGRFEQGILEPDPEDTAIGKPLTQRGYVIYEVSEPSWTPQASEEILKFRDIIGVSASTLSDLIGPNRFFIGWRDTIDPTTFKNFVENNVSPPPENIYSAIQQDPENINIAFNYRNSVRANASTLHPRREWVKTNFPGGSPTAFGEQETMLTEIKTTEVDEDDIVEPEDENNENSPRRVSRAKFDALHDLYANEITFQEPGPYLTYSYTVPFLAAPNLVTIEKGIQEISISVGSTGLEATYTFGNESQKPRDPDTFRKPMRTQSTQARASTNTFMVFPSQPPRFYGRR